MRYKEGTTIPPEKLRGFTLLETNKIKGANKQKKRRRSDEGEDVEASCNCKKNGCCCDDDTCMYRACKEECPPWCACGKKCKNQRLQRRQYPKLRFVQLGVSGTIAAQDCPPILSPHPTPSHPQPFSHSELSTDQGCGCAGSRAHPCTQPHSRVHRRGMSP